MSLGLLPTTLMNDLLLWSVDISPACATYWWPIITIAACGSSSSESLFSFLHSTSVCKLDLMPRSISEAIEKTHAPYSLWASEYGLFNMRAYLQTREDSRDSPDLCYIQLPMRSTSSSMQEKAVMHSWERTAKTAPKFR
jgi:hypothetical protein